MNIAIEKMKPEDLDIIYEIGIQEKEFRASDAPGFWPKEILLKWTQSDNDIALVAKEKDEIIGFILVAIPASSSKAYFENLWVKKEYRKGGVGKMLTESATNKLKETRIRYFVGMVEEENIPSQKALESYSFVKGKKFYWFVKEL